MDIKPKHIIIAIIAIIALYSLNEYLETEGFYGYSRAEGFKGGNANAGNSPTLILFKSEHCIHCKRLKPVWNKVARHYRNKKVVYIQEIDINKNPSTVKTVPTIRFYPHGIADSASFVEYTGDRTQADLKAFIDQMISKTTSN